MKKEVKDKKGLSPVIATVLLLAMVVVIGLIIFLWFLSFTQESVVKNGLNVDLACDDVAFRASYSSGKLFISNDGNVPIFNMKVKIVSSGSFVTKDLSEISKNEKWEAAGLNQGSTFSDELKDVNGNEIILIPVLLGDSDEGKKTHVCDEVRHGFKIIL